MLLNGYEVQVAPAGKRLALVIGVNKAGSAFESQLHHALADAEAMAEVLQQRCGFELVVLPLLEEQASSEAIRKAVRQLARDRTDDDFLLLYFAGHGLPMTVEADRYAVYLGSSDVDKRDIEEEEASHISLKWLRERLYEGTEAGYVLLILDCCFSGNMSKTASDRYLEELKQRIRYYSQELGENSQSRSGGLRFALTATGHHAPAAEGKEHGLMTGKLLSALRGKVDAVLDIEHQGEISLPRLYDYLKRAMPVEQPPSLAGDSAGRACILASYPERAAQLRSHPKHILEDKQPHSYIPFPRNPLFQPRPGEFERLETLLSGMNAEQPARIGLVGVTGMGGIGKTQLAVELAYRLQEQHSFAASIFWTPATGTNVFAWQRHMAELAFNADYLPPDDDPSSPENEARRARYFCRYLANHAEALLILDNVEDPNQITSALPILAGGSLACSILYTSRMTQTPQGVVAHSVEQLPEYAALRLLLETTRPAVLSETLSGSQSAEARAARFVCQMVGYVPLALTHLRSSLLQDRQVSLCRLGEVLTNRGISGVAAKVTETFRLSWQKVRTEEAHRMFLLASYFPEAAPIPLWLLGLASGLGENGDIFEPLGQARFELLELSLLEELSNEQVRLHPLVRVFGQQLVREMVDQGMDLRQEASQRLVETGTDLNWLEDLAHKQGYGTCLEHVQEMHTYAQLLDITTSVEALQRIERILDQESYLLADEQWWPKRLPELFCQQLYNRAIEIGQPIKAKQAPLHWLRQTKPGGAMDRSLLRIFAGHTESVSSVAFSPDGKLVLTGSRDQTARLWETSSGKQLTVFQGHTESVSSVAFSPDGKLVLTGSRDQTARLWETSSGKALTTFHGHTEPVSSVAFSPDGKLVLTGSWDWTARLWETSSGKQLTVFQGHTDWVESVAFSPDGKLVLTGSDDQPMRLWETSSGKQLTTFHGHASSVSSVAFSPDGKLVLTGSRDWTARLWETSSGKALTTFHGHTEPVSSVAFSPDGKLVLTGSFDQTARLWETSSGKALTTFHGHTNGVKSIAFSPDGKLVLTGSSDQTARLWETSSGKALTTFHRHTSTVKSIAFSPDGKLVLTSSFDQTTRLWKTSSSKQLTTFHRHTNMLDLFKPLVHLLSGKALTVFLGHISWVESVAFSPDGKLVLTGSSDKIARLWETSSGKHLTTFRGHTDYVMSVAFSPDGKLVLTGSLDKIARLWETSSGKHLTTFRGHTDGVKNIAFSPDGKLVLTGSFDQTARLWETSSGKHLTTFHGCSVAFSPDGKHILTGSSDKIARLWEISTGKELTTFQGHTSEVDLVTFSPDGSLAITCDRKGWVCFWRVNDLGAKDPLAVYVAYYPVAAIYWPDKTHLILADTGRPRNYPYFYYLKLEMG